MREHFHKLSSLTIGILSSGYFFQIILALFVIEATWIAFSFLFPMPYDERYHFGLISYFSNQWLPWIPVQPAELDQYGAFERDSYLLYHYVLSFPFRIISLLTDNLAIQVISLRLINVGIFIVGLIIFNKLLKEMKVKRIFRNISLLILVILPVTPFVAATINYDSGVFLLTSIFLLLGFYILRSPIIRWDYWILFLIVGMAGSLTKSAFLPIFATGFIFLIAKMLYKRSQYSIPRAVMVFKRASTIRKIIVIVPLVIIGALFIERFAVNVIQYRSLSPSCIKQLSKERCLSSPINNRAERMANSKPKDTVQLPYYMGTWASTMAEGLAATGSIEKGQGEPTIRPALPVLFAVLFGLILFAVTSMIYSFDQLRWTPGFWLFTIVVAVYISALFFVNVSAYYEYHRYLAIQGRYLLPVLPLLLIFGLLGINYTLKRVQVIKLPLLALTFGLLVIGGAGLTTHIVRSSDSWYWNNEIVRDVNGEARDILKPVVKEEW